MSNAKLHQVRPASSYYVDIILPLAIAKPYTYWVPEAFVSLIQVGIRVEVQFGKSKLYTGLILRIHQNAPDYQSPKEVISIIDEQPIVNEKQFKLWRWIAAYYGCSLGEVMHAALPANFKLTSETKITLGPLFNDEPEQLNDKEYLIAEALSIQEELSIKDIQGILDQKTVYPIIKKMLDKRIVYLKEDLQQKYKAKKVNCIRFQEPYATDPNSLHLAFELVGKAVRQEEALLALFKLSSNRNSFANKTSSNWQKLIIA